MPPLRLLLDVFGIATALLGALVHGGASPPAAHLQVRELDAADINRIVTAINRSNLLNGRAALAAPASAASLAVRFGADLLARL